MKNIMMGDIIQELQERFGDEVEVVEGAPAICTQKGTLYQTRCHLAKKHYFKDDGDVYDFLYQMAKCAVRLMAGDTISVRSAEVSEKEGGVYFWLRICQESSKKPDEYRKVDAGYEKIVTPSTDLAAGSGADNEA